MPVKNIKIENFKSIKNLEFEAKRINIFIGKPNTGKSNILEVFNIYSLPYNMGESHIKDMIRMKNDIDIVFNKDKELNVKIQIDEIEFRYDPIVNNDMKLSRSYDKKTINPIKYYKFDSESLIYPKEKNRDYM